MKILLVGGHNKLNFLTKSLKEMDHDVTVINKDKNFCQLISDTHEVLCICGDGTKPSTLKDACVSSMDVVIALTNDDASNLIICEIAKKQFNVKNTYAIVNNPKNINLFKEFGVDKCISAIQIITEILA